MKATFFSRFLIGLLVVEKIRGYAYGPLLDRLILYNMQYTTFITCQFNATLLRAAIRANIPVENVPPRNIMAEDVSYHLFTRKNPKSSQILRQSDSLDEIRSSDLNFENEIVFYVHGYNGTITVGVSNFTTYLLPKKDVNIIIVDWDSYSFFDVVYVRAFVVPELGKLLGRFVQKLIHSGADPEKINLIGFSAGGEVVGLAGKVIDPKVARVTAFDPEGSCFNFLPPEKRISKSSAEYVQIVHCSVGVRALPPYIEGDSTFVVDGGVIQSSCIPQTKLDDVEHCSHNDCQTYLFDTLKGNRSLVGTKCASYADYFLNQCDSQNRVLLTYDVPTSVKGFYFVETDPYKLTND